MTIRQEIPADYPEVYRLIQKAFASAEHADGNEQDLVEALRKGDAFLPELSLVAEVDGRLAGHILFTKIKINGQTELALAPLAVLPEYQRQGVGKALIAEGHRIAREMGYHYSVVLGSAEYYPKFGYRPAVEFGIRCPFDVPDENYMVIDLQGNSAPVSGIVEYAKEFAL